MAIAFIGAVSAGSTGGDTVTTGTLNTSGATLLILALSDFSAATVSAITDSKSNTWTALTASSQTCRMTIFYVPSPTVGSGHTFTATKVAGSTYPSIVAMAFSGAKLTSPADASETGGTALGVTSKQPGTMTPSENGEVVINGIGFGFTNSNVAIDAGTIPTGATVNYSAANHFGISAAYLIQTTAAASNPTWSWTTSVDASVRQAAFKAAAGGGLRRNSSLNGLGASGSFFHDPLAMRGPYQDRRVRA